MYIEYRTRPTNQRDEMRVWPNGSDNKLPDPEMCIRKIITNSAENFSFLPGRKPATSTSEED